MSNVCVVGLGKIGLPLACAIALGGHKVRGADISPEVVDTVNRAEEPFPGEAGLRDALAEVIGSGALIATSDTRAAVESSEVVVVVVPLIVDGDAKPDFRAMDSATTAVAAGLQPDSLVIYETTLPVRTTRNRFTEALAEGSGLTPGVDMFVAHSPERVFSGRIFSDLRTYPKLVGGIDTASARRAVEFYESFLDFDQRDDLTRPNGVWNLGSAEAAEMAKLAETTYRDLNIAYANELSMAAEHVGVDVHKVIEACNSQPFSHIHQPGISVGGHCIPVYPHLLMDSLPGFRLPAVAREINRDAVTRAVVAVEEDLGGLEATRIAILGVAFRPGVKEDAFSGVYPLVAEFSRRGAEVAVHDPLYSGSELEARGLVPYAFGQPADAVVLHTAHGDYERLAEIDFPGVRVVYDGRRSFADSHMGTARIIGPGRTE